MNDVPEKKPIWNSLEIAKLSVPIFASILLALVGYQISKSLEDYKSEVARNNKILDNLIERNNKIDDTLNAKRTGLYDEVGKKLNQMFAYYMYFGRWKEISPEDIIRHKRDLDEIIYTYSPIFSRDFIDIYEGLAREMFQPYGGWGTDAKLRTSIRRRQEFFLPSDVSKVWKQEWKDRYTEEDNTGQIKEYYSKLLTQLPRELGFLKTRNIDAQQLGKPNLPPKG